MKSGLILILLFYSCIVSEQQNCLRHGRILGATSDGTHCDVLRWTEDDVSWLMCTGVKNTVPVTELVQTVLPQTFKTFLKTKNINFIDFFIHGSVTHGMGLKSDRLVCFSTVAMDEDQDLLKCGSLDITEPKDLNGLTGVERITFNRTGFTIYSYKQEGVRGKFLVINERTKETIITKIDAGYRIDAVIYLGVSKRTGLPLIGGITTKKVTIVYELQGVKLKKVVDKRPNEHLLGCPPQMCLEGTVDSVYRLSHGMDNGIYIKRLNSLHKIPNIGSQIVAVNSNDDNIYDVSFVVTIKEAFDGKICYISYGQDRKVFCPNSSYAIDTLFKEVPKSDKIFAVVEVNYDHYYFFAGNKIYYYVNQITSDNLTMKFMNVYETRKRFHNLWTSFDAAFKEVDSKHIYFFNHDFNVKYEWNDEGLMTPISEPELNQKTFWNCAPNSVDETWLRNTFEVDTLNQYYENVVKKYRYIPLGEMTINPSSEPPKKTETTKVVEDEDDSFLIKKSKSDPPPKWLIPIIIVASLVGLIMLIALIMICYNQRRKARSDSTTRGHSVGKTMSFVSVSTVKEPVIVKRKGK